MKFWKKFVSLSLVIIMAITLVPTIALADSTPSNWSVTSIEEAKALGLATNDLMNNFSATTTRLEFCRAAVNLLRLYGYDIDSVTPKMFSDTNDKDIGIAAALGITNGTDLAKNLFSPNNPLTREQAATLLNNLLGVIGRRKTSATVAWTDSAKISSWAIQSANDMYNCGVISGTDTTKLVFSPQTAYTHEQSIVTLLRTWRYIDPTNDTYDSSGYNLANLRKSKNEVVLTDDVRKITVTQSMNTLVSADENNRRYVFDNIDGSVKNLSVGDKFIVYPCSLVPDGVAIIVSSIQINGNNAVIYSSDVALSDIVESMDVAQIVPMTSDMIVELGEGVTPLFSTSAKTPTYGMNTSIQTSSIYASVRSNDGYPIKTMAAASGSISQSFSFNVNIPINDSISVTGTVTVTPTLKADIDLREGWFNLPTGIDYFELSLDNQLTASLDFEAAYSSGDLVHMPSIYRIQDGTLKQKYANYKMNKARCEEYRSKLFTSEFPIPTAPGLAATVSWYLKVSAEGQISIVAEYTQNNSLGIKLENGKWSPINTNSSNISVHGAADATVYAGAGISIGLSYVRVVAATVDPEIGIEIAASTAFDESLLDNILTGTSAESSHDCVICVDGDVNLRLSLGASVEAFGFGSVDIGEMIKPIRWKLADFYYTVGGTSHGQEFGLTVCPYIKNITGSLNGHKYELFNYSMPWYEAKVYCENLGGHLAVITSSEEETYIDSLIAAGAKDNYWLGATDELVEGTWRWVSGEAWDFTFWKGWQPDNNTGIEHYLHYAKAYGGWNDHCYSAGDTNSDSNFPLNTFGFICEWEN